MGVATGCGCKEVHVYRLPHTTYPYSSCICSFLQQHPYFLFIFKKVLKCFSFLLCFSFLFTLHLNINAQMHIYFLSDFQI